MRMISMKNVTMKISPLWVLVLLAVWAWAPAAFAQPVVCTNLSSADGCRATLPCQVTPEQIDQARQIECPFPGTPNAPPYCHPYPQPRPAASAQCTEAVEGGYFTAISTGYGYFEPSNPFSYETFPGTNFLPTVYTNAFDGAGQEVVNTLPSTPKIPYNLHDGDPVVSTIDPTSPDDDLGRIFNSILENKIPEIVQIGAERESARRGEWTTYEEEHFKAKRAAIAEDIEGALDILEGEPVPYRFYSGIPMLHFHGPEKVKAVQPIRDGSGEIVGGNVDVHQIWFGQHIEADTAFVDPSPVLKDDMGQPLDVPWTITYTVDVLTGGHDDFSPFVTYTDDPAVSGYVDPNTCESCQPGDPGCVQKGPMPNVGMDQTFFNMEDGTRTVFKIEMAPAKYLNLVYTWGWRMHPPRIQVMEKAIKKINYTCNEDLSNCCNKHESCPTEYHLCTLPQLEQHAFCNPNDPATAKISQGESYVPPTADGFDLGERTNTCHLESLPNCGSVTCGPGEARFDADGQPTQCERNKLYAIAQIGDLAPAKRMWNALKKASCFTGESSWVWRNGEAIDICAGKSSWKYQEIRREIERAEAAYRDWQDRTQLPAGVEVDPDSDVTILYANNTIYGELTEGGWVRWMDWEARYPEWQKEDAAFTAAFAEWQEALAAWEAGPKTTPPPQPPERPAGPPILDVTAYNDDLFPHSYTIADFGGSRGWENQFKSSVKVGGSGCWFTFGRAYWNMVAGAPNGFLCVPEQADKGPGVHKFSVQFNYEPSRRLRFYQFDPMHHDVAIYSIH